MSGAAPALTAERSQVPICAGAFWAVVAGSLFIGVNAAMDHVLGLTEPSWRELVMGPLGAAPAALYLKGWLRLVVQAGAPPPPAPEAGALVVEAEADSMRALTEAKRGGRAPSVAVHYRHGIALSALALYLMAPTRSGAAMWFFVLIGWWGDISVRFAPGRRTPLP